MMPGFSIAMTDRTNNPNVTLTDALPAALDHADEAGLAGPIVENLRKSLQAGCDAIPPPDGGTRVTIVQPDGGEREAA